MTDVQEAPDTTGHELLERGRYAIDQNPDGSWFILRAAPICERCQACGCGEPQEPLKVPLAGVKALTGQPLQPADLMAMMADFSGGGKMNPAVALKRLMSMMSGGGNGRAED